ncbi:MAG: HIT domain-containing protein [Candidatus Woykebacteria bacterium]
MTAVKNDCPFCEFNEDRVLKEGKHSYVIFSNPRLMPGHLLVITRRHIQRLSQMNNEERDEVLNFVTEFEERILEKLSKGCDIRQNFKPYVENSKTHIKHFHFHLNPRVFEDELYEKADVYRKPLYKELTGEERDKIAKLLIG